MHTDIPPMPPLARPQARPLPTLLCAGYGAGMVGGQIFRDTPAFLLLPFLTNTLDRL